MERDEMKSFTDMARMPFVMQLQFLKAFERIHIIGKE